MPTFFDFLIKKTTETKFLYQDSYMSTKFHFAPLNFCAQSRFWVSSSNLHIRSTVGEFQFLSVGG